MSFSKYFGRALKKYNHYLGLEGIVFQEPIYVRYFGVGGRGLSYFSLDNR